jgi:hypothetical protein
LAEIALLRGDAAGARDWAGKAYALLGAGAEAASRDARLERLRAIAAGKIAPAEAQ